MLLHGPSHLADFSSEPENIHNPFPVVDKDVCLDPASDALVSKVKILIEKCAEPHGECAASVADCQCMPKRLRALDDGIRLVSPVDAIRYAALSYCWGGYDQHRTQRSNVQARHKCIEFSELPRTLQDAVLFTRKLDLRYIWIDSLCIVQDDRTEWAEEAAHMADIYSGAYIVLAATRAADATSGFLQHRKEPYSIISHTLANHPFELQARRTGNH
jgi:hypothetical protein